ncbi:MAG: transporter substrate-binding domain-containing protein [Chitinispirillales bacterium]|jgi:polar amino acid transport system substrate-binding protein|nr:transporter substrate-binding domain-containing protein [Chitinispirillales bacterium]
MKQWRIIMHKPFITALIAVALSFSACSKSGSGGSGGSGRFVSLADFGGAKIASEVGTVFAGFIDRVIPNVEHKYYVTVAAAMNALLADSVDALSIDMPIALYLTARDTNLAVFPYVVAEDKYGFAVAKGSRLGAMCNGALQKLEGGGAIEELEKIWFSADEERKVLPELNYRKDFDGSAGTIRYGCHRALFPMSYVTPDGRHIGFDIDLVNRIAYELNMTLEMTALPFSELLPSVLSGKVDIAGGSISITEERLEQVDFIGPYFESGAVLIIKKSRMPS